MAKKKSSGSKKGTQEEKIIRDVFRDVTDMLKATSGSGKDSLEEFDLNGAVRKRRRQAILAMLPQMKIRYSDDYPDDSLLTEDFAWLCYSPGLLTNDVESNYYVSVASAMWMLDTLEQAGTLSEAAPYFPIEEDMEYDTLPPSFTDVTHDSSLLVSLSFLIQHLNSGDQHFFLNDTSAKSQPITDNPEPDRSPEALSGRERFHAILKRIPQDQKDHAVQSFQKKYWELLDLCFSILSSCGKEIQAIQKKRSTGGSAAYAKPDLQVFPPSAPQAGQNFSKAAEGLCPFPHGISGQPEGRQAGIPETSLIFSNLQDLILLEDKRQSLGAFMGYLLEGVGKRCFEIFPFGQKEIDTLMSLEVEDPYEICFGYLYLLESGSDLPWTYNPANTVLLSACRKLPWSVVMLNPLDMEKEEEEFPEGDAGGNQEENPEEKETGISDVFPDPENPDFEEKVHRLLLTLQDVPGQAERNTRLYREIYEARPILDMEGEGFPGRRLNIPQIIYSYTGWVLPRFYGFWVNCAEDLEKGGMNPEEARAMELYINMLFNLPSRDEPESDESLPDPEILEIERNCAEEERDRLAEDLDRIREERDRLAEENRELKHALSRKQEGLV